MKLTRTHRRLLRKVDLATYKSDANHREQVIRARYYLQDPLDYKKYNTLCGSLRQLAHRLSELDPDSDPIRKKIESEVLEKLWSMGILKQSREQGAGLSRVEREVTVSAFCRRRLAVVMVRNGMVETVKAVCPSPSLLFPFDSCFPPFFFFFFFFRLRQRMPSRYTDGGHV